MKKWILIFVGISVVAGLILLARGNDMREIRTEIEIAAPPAKVWSILMNFDAWKEWNPIVVQATGIASLGSELVITMKNEDGKDGPKYAPVVGFM